MTFTRPFRNAHILLPIALFIGAEYLLFRDPCAPRPIAVYTAFTAAVVCLAGWLAHLRVGPLHDWRVALRLMHEALGDLLKFALAVLFASLFIFLPMPAVDCYTPRSDVSELLTVAAVLKADISERYAARHTLTNIGEGVHMESLRPGGKVWVTSDGSIFLFSAKAGTALLEKPSAGPDGLTWQCMGAPDKYLPSPCRER
jgi:hypothetical protein